MLPQSFERINGVTYDLAPNPFGLRSVRVDFPGGDVGTLVLTDDAGAVERPMGLDGVYRWSAGPNGVQFGLTARWTDGLLYIDYNTVGDIRAYTITARYVEDAVELTITQRDEFMSATVAGRAR